MDGLLLLGQAADYYDYSYGTSSSAADFSPALFVGIMLFSLVIAAIFYVVHAYFLGRIFKKAGVESWKAWVPIYNSWVTLELGGQKGFWAILAIVPLLNIVSLVFMIIAMYHIGLRLGKEGVFVLLAIFVPIVWLIWLALDSSTWDNGGPDAGSFQPAYAPPVQQPSPEPPHNNLP